MNDQPPNQMRENNVATLPEVTEPFQASGTSLHGTEQRSSRQSVKRFVTVRLDTLLLMMTLIAVVVAYYVADRNLVLWQSRLARLETVLDLPRVHNIRNIELSPMGNLRWSVWVPNGRRVKLSVATENLDSPAGSKDVECKLKPGRNIIKIATSTQRDALSVLLNDEELFQRKFTRLWNLQSLTTPQLVPLVIGPSRSMVTVTKQNVFFQSMSSVRLEADEAFDPIKHRCGLRLWLEP